VGGCKQMSEPPNKIKVIKYEDIFSPPVHYLACSMPGIEKQNINTSIIKRAVSDASLYGRDIGFFKAVFDPQLNQYHYMFYVKFHEDMMCVYSVDATTSKILYMFLFFPS
jgi:hypothetical protein